MIANLSSSKELNMMTTKITAVALVLSLALSSASAFAQAAMANGEVKKIDEAAEKSR